MEMDPGTAIVLGAGIYLAKDLTEKALGPTAEYLGEGLKKFTEMIGAIEKIPIIRFLEIRHQKPTLYCLRWCHSFKTIFLRKRVNLIYVLGLRRTDSKITRITHMKILL